MSDELGSLSMSDGDYQGPERRSQTVIQYSAPEVGWLRKVEALGPLAVVGAALAVAWGGFDVRMQTVEGQLAELRGLPLQISELNRSIDQTMNAQFAELSQRLATVEQRSQRSYENIQRLWEVSRDNQGKVASLMADKNLRLRGRAP